MDQTQAASADSRVPEPDVENPGVPADLGRNPANVGSLEEFVQNMAENIIRSLVSQMETVEPEVSGFDGDLETLADELALAVIETTLREACGGGNVEGFQSSISAGENMDEEQAESLALSDGAGRGRDFLITDTELDPDKESPSPKDIQPNHPPLSQSGLPVVGSLDYPDAPPTTPLLPELERSRHSFARKLKGGLAKVFLPSPPPPTPKEVEEEAGSVDSPRVELIEHLFRSLSTHDLARDHAGLGPQHGAKMAAFADNLSCDIIDWALRAKSGERLEDDDDLHLLAQRLAETIITSSLDETKMTL